MRFCADPEDIKILTGYSRAKEQRQPLTEIAYRKIYNHAETMGYEALQIAMAISQYTALRESDVCALRFDRHIKDDEMRVIVSKSDAQKGTARATRLFWNLEKHPKLKKIINRARELAMQNNACPYIVSHRPERRVWNQDKEHLCQVMPDRLSRMFAEVRDACGISNTSFHEVRGLSITLMRKKGYTVDQIKNTAGHEHINTTKGYMDADNLPHEEVLLVL